MNLATKMIINFLLVVMVAAVGFCYTIWKVNAVAELVDNANNTDLPRLLKTNKINNNASDEVGYMSEYYITKNSEMLNDYKKTAADNRDLEDEMNKNSVTAEGKRLITEVKTLDDKYSEIADKKFVLLIQAGKDAEARQVMISEMAPAAKALNDKLDEYQNFRNKQITNSLNQALDHAQQTRTVAVFAAVLAAILGMAIGFFAARRISRPVNELAVVARKVAAGDLTEQVKIDSQDEIGQLAAAFNTMVLQLKDLIKHVTVNAEQVAASSEELTANAEQSAQATNQVALSITDVAAGANEQMEAASEASNVVETMSAGIQQIAANANQVAAQSANAADKAKNGGKEVEMAVKQMSQIEDTVNSSAQVVAKLGERSKEIGQIVDTISGIAGQTNLLALNAAIEAARAGEQGKGFAVVAEEVRKLAEQSQEAAKKIAELIGDIQGDTDKAVIAMNEGTQEVKTGAEVVNAAGIAFKEIMEVIDQVSDQVKEISAAIQQMATGSQQIVGSVKKIDDLSKKSAGESQSVSAATEEQLASMEEIATASQTLAQLAQELQTAVTKFRV
ncbi:methyl-accepting chemotaxis protein [Sporomusaceae bacterium BoRhaA]|uniref:methyl-accepting chemotaxis protein n=1 Tax=Pelorhabdus rhamnosifermentans TaxID=2772457 RepID=UPI001C0611F5|nr:methyl-accepting chemotaxis protein [Pelorhabdus rhamnosifermentans]MBU2703846.1 methyl-accepting chemotaxis protein [Pelorhabdus rhamnosifermentans]